MSKDDRQMGMGWLSQTQHSHYSLVGDQDTVRFLKALKVVTYVWKQSEI